MLNSTGLTGQTSFSTAGLQVGDRLTITATKVDYLPYVGSLVVTIGPVKIQRGDANLDGPFDISDPVTVLSALFLGTGKIGCADAADATGDKQLDISDPVRMLNALFLGGKIAEGDPNCQ